MTTTDPLGPAMGDALAVLTACDDGQDSFAPARTSGLTDQQVLHRLGTTVARA